MTRVTNEFYKLCRPNFHNESLPISLRAAPPTTVLKENIKEQTETGISNKTVIDVNSFVGVEATFLKSLMNRFNFQIKIIHCTMGTCLDRMYEEKIVILGNKVGVKQLRKEHAEFSISVGFDKLCIVIGENMLPGFNTEFLNNSRLTFLALEGLVFVSILIIWLCILKWSRGFKFWENLG